MNNIDDLNNSEKLPEKLPEKLLDVQNNKAEYPIPIEKVGVKKVQIPLVVKDKSSRIQHTVANVDMAVNLPAHFKGTHMSRFLESLEEWREKNPEGLDYASLKVLLENVRVKLQAYSAYIRFEFPYFCMRQAPVSGAQAPVSYLCAFIGEHNADGKTHFELEINVPVTTVCPCSKAISKGGAHGQRTLITLKISMKKFNWIEDFIELANMSGSAPIYTLIKRQDEKALTEMAYDKAYFVEDVVRSLADKLNSIPDILSYSIEAESQESIHPHNAFALVRKSELKN